MGPEAIILITFVAVFGLCVFGTLLFTAISFIKHKVQERQRVFTDRSSHQHTELSTNHSPPPSYESLHLPAPHNTTQLTAPELIHHHIYRYIHHNSKENHLHHLKPLPEFQHKIFCQQLAPMNYGCACEIHRHLSQLQFVALCELAQSFQCFQLRTKFCIFV